MDWFDTNTAIAGSADHPQYECPKCRTPVYQNPIENFTLKGVVRAISHRIDPASESPPPPLRQNMGAFGPWFGFFGQ